MVESEAEQIYERALHEDVAFLVVGDPLWYIYPPLPLALLLLLLLCTLDYAWMD
jgi:hypothetical protein